MAVSEQNPDVEKYDTCIRDKEQTVLANISNPKAGPSVTILI